jgi:GAF domain-containing protein
MVNSEGAAPDNDAELVRTLRSTLALAATTETVSTHGSHTQLLELIVQIAARVINAQTASLLLLDDDQQELIFTVAFPHLVTDLQGVRVPLGQGVAGLVAMTGQPMAIANARDDPRHAATIAEQTGYLPASLLCVPLQFGDDIVGVLELMDKQGADAFDSADMETLGLFAQLAAVAIEQSRTRSNLASMLFEVPALRGLSTMAASVEQDPRFKQTLELAQLVHQIGQAGGEEINTCLGILRSFAGYIQHRSQPWRA